MDELMLSNKTDYCGLDVMIGCVHIETENLPFYERKPKIRFPADALD